jgi:hypothetical protein
LSVQTQEWLGLRPTQPVGLIADLDRARAILKPEQTWLKFGKGKGDYEQPQKRKSGVALRSGVALLAR